MSSAGVEVTSPAAAPPVHRRAAGHRLEPGRPHHSRIRRDLPARRPHPQHL